MPSEFISYEQVDHSCVGSLPPTEKAVPGSLTDKYKELKITYKYPNGTLDEFLMEGCEVSCPRGIEEKTDPKSGNVSFSVMMVMNEITDPKCKLFNEKFKFSHAMSAVQIEKHRNALGLHKFTAKSALEDESYKSPLYYPLDKTNGQLIDGKSPTMYVKLTKLSFASTLFTQPDGKTEIPWKLLTKAEFKMIPLIHLSHVYIAGKPSFQVKLKSAVVTDLKGINSESLQKTTSETLTKENPSLNAAVAQAMARLAMERQDADVKLVKSGMKIPEGKQEEKAKVESDSGQNGPTPTPGTGTGSEGSSFDKIDVNQFLKGQTSPKTQ